MEVTKREFYVIIERDEDGYYVGEVPQLKARDTQDFSNTTTLIVAGEERSKSRLFNLSVSD